MNIYEKLEKVKSTSWKSGSKSYVKMA